jgi:hypothetical protein
VQGILNVYLGPCASKTTTRETMQTVQPLWDNVGYGLRKMPIWGDFHGDARLGQSWIGQSAWSYCYYRSRSMMWVQCRHGNRAIWVNWGKIH